MTDAEACPRESTVAAIANPVGPVSNLMRLVLLMRLSAISGVKIEDYEA
jgi:hypothetical protein